MIVRRLPGALAHRYGADDFYTSGQVRATATVVGIRDRYVPFALAAMFTEQEYLSADPEHDEWAYRKRRNMVADESGLAEADLRGMKLVSRFASNRSGPGNSGHESMPAVDDTGD